MRIAHVSATFPPYLGGAGNVCDSNAKELARRGHEVHVFTAAVEGAPACEVRDRFTVHRLPRLIQIGNMPLLPNLASVLRGFDVVHLHYPFILGAELVRLAAIMSKTPLVVSFHNDLIGDRARAHLFRIYQAISAKLTIRNANRLCVVSSDHYQFSRLHRSLGHLPIKVEELPNGVDLDLFQPDSSDNDIRDRYSIPQNAKLALFVAALDRAHHFKGLSFLLQSAATLPPDVWLLVVGDGDQRESYQEQALRLGIADRTIFAGAIQHEKTPPYFRSADVTILPSLPPESFGLVLIESLACGTPVIATRLPGVRTVVEDGRDGLLVEPGRPASLAEAMRKILDDEGHRRAMGTSGRAKVEARYGWKGIGAQLECIYDQVLSDAKRNTAPSGQHE
jgi:glycosyltransferase involved in cell wall biosynthesis